MTRKLFPTRVTFVCILIGFLMLMTILTRVSHGRRPGHTNLHISVTVKGKPVVGADVLVKSQSGVEEFEEQAPTDVHGMAIIAGVPWGKALIQITAACCPSSGQSYEMNRSEQTIAIQMKTFEEEKPPSPTPTPTRTPPSSDHLSKGIVTGFPRPTLNQVFPRVTD